MFASSLGRFILPDGKTVLEEPWKWPEEYLLNVSELIIKTRTEAPFQQLRFPFSDPTRRRWASAAF